MNSPIPGPAAGAAVPHYPPAPRRPRVGRLVPLPGVVLRSDPERMTVQHFLQAIAVPVAAMQTLLEVAVETKDAACSAMALGAMASHRDYLAELAADFTLLGELEQDRVQVVAGDHDLTALGADIAERLGAVALRHGSELRAEPRSFLPSSVTCDRGLALRALDAVLRVAATRCYPGRIDLGVSFHDGRGAHGPRLCFDLVTNGGGFGDVELGYVFRPFAVVDAAGRPQLGLSIAQRLSELLGGELRVLSPGPATCHYRLAVAAPAAAGAHWRDPLAPTLDLGPVQ